MILNNVKDIKLGSSQVDKIYKGNSLIWSKSILPSGYTRIKYLQNNNSHDSYSTFDYYHINTNHKYSEVTRIIAEIEEVFDRYISNEMVFSGGRATTPYITLRQQSVGITVNSYAYVDSILDVDFKSTNNNNIYLSGWTDAVWTSPLRVKSLKMFNGNEVVFDGIPCLDKNNVPCMYDVISKRTLYNGGSKQYLYEI